MKKHDLLPAAGSSEMLRRSFLAACGIVGAAALAGCNGERPPQEAPKRRRETFESPDPGRMDSDDEVIRGLAELEARCGGELFTGAMQFFTVPAAVSPFAKRVDWQPGSLKELEKYGLQPTIILEPDTEVGASYGELHTWPLDKYAAAMGKPGAISKPPGRVVIAPEFIVGGWHGNAPENFVPTVEYMTRKLRGSFNGAEPTVLIDTSPQEVDALLPQLDQNGKKLSDFGITSVGVQAFSNSAEIPFNGGKADISGFLDMDVIERIAKAAGVEEVWVNTGLIKRDTKLEVGYTLQQRIAMAQAIGDVLKQVQQRGIKVGGLVVFAEDKSNDEGRDFSFSPGDEPALIALAEHMKELGIPLSGFAIAA